MAKKDKQETTGPVRAVGYARVSTRDKQEIGNQINPIGEYCRGKGYELLEIYQDKQSGAKTANERENLGRMMRDVKEGRAKVVVVWALDRLTREGILPALTYIRELADSGAKFESVTEPHFTTSGPFGELFIAFAATIAKMERERLGERVKAGITIARAKGIKFGRQPVEIPRECLDKVLAGELTIRAAAKQYQVSTSPLHRAVLRIQRESREGK